MREENKIEDPVCKMKVETGQLSFSYLGIEYSFCSQQCCERFSANPHLYVGSPGKPSPKQHDVRIIKRRLLKLDEIIPENVASDLEVELKQTMGIKEVTIDKGIVRITYDLLEATSEQIEAKITESDKKLAAGWGDKIKRAFIHYLEESQLEILENQPSSHNHNNNI